MGLSRVERLLNFCGMCGACYGRGPEVPHNWREINPDPAPVKRCPSLEYFGFRTYSAMDRFSLATAMQRENYPITEDLKTVFYSCMMCGICNELCGIFDPVDIIRAAREEIAEYSTLLPEYKKLLENFREYGNPWRKPHSDRDKWIHNLGVKDITKERAENLLYLGCAVSLRPGLREMADAVVDVLTRAEVDFGILGSQEKCCGYIPWMVGDRELYNDYMATNIQLFNELGIKKLIILCPECLATFKSYPQGEMNFEIVHSVQYIDQLLKEEKLKPSGEIRSVVTYHDPCNLGRGSRVFVPPRDLIKSIPGIQFVEMYRHGKWSYCCGRGGGVSYAFPDYMRFTSEERIREGIETEAEIVITACPQCYIALQGAAASRGEIRVEDIHILLSRSLSKK